METWSKLGPRSMLREKGDGEAYVFETVKYWYVWSEPKKELRRISVDGELLATELTKRPETRSETLGLGHRLNTAMNHARYGDRLTRIEPSKHRAA